MSAFIRIKIIKDHTLKGPPLHKMVIQVMKALLLNLLFPQSTMEKDSIKKDWNERKNNSDYWTK